MSENINLDLMGRRITQLESENENLRRQSDDSRLKAGGGDGTSGGMDIIVQRLDRLEKRTDAADARMGRVEDKLGNIQVTLATLATRDTLRNWGIALAAVVIATGLTVGGLLLQSANNQLSAFQAGLSAIQAVASARQMGAAAPPINGVSGHATR